MSVKEELRPLLSTPSNSQRASSPSQQDSSKKKKEGKSVFRRCKDVIFPPRRLVERTVPISGNGMDMNCPNVIRNQKFTFWNFLPINLYHQFKSFINFYYLILTISQFFPVLKVGPIWTNALPLAFVVSLSIGMELFLDVRRMLRDRELNGEKYKRLTKNGIVELPSSEIQVGHFIIVETNRRIPADMVLLRTTGESGASYIRTDQLDGETDWKLRRAITVTQQLEKDDDLFNLRDCSVWAEQPQKKIDEFNGNFIEGKHQDGPPDSLSIENTLWASTVLASDTIIGLVVYTGADTRSVLNTNQPKTKKGKLNIEVNKLTILLCVVEFFVGMLLVVAGVFKGIWWLNYFRFLVLVSSIIPISMSVNMDLAKFVYAFNVVTDKMIPGCMVRNTTIPEELGRISFLMSDKTGTLTQNDMIFKRLNLRDVNLTSESIDEIRRMVKLVDSGDFDERQALHQSTSKLKVSAGKQTATKVHDAILALALCHNVNPVHNAEDEHEEVPQIASINGKKLESESEDLEYHSLPEADQQEEKSGITYQASSPDEVALVKFTESVGITLWDRTFSTITLKNSIGARLEYEILESFPFTSERKRMGIILRNSTNGEIRFLMKGADVIMEQIVEREEWLREECNNLAREGLRTLVFGQKVLSEEEWEDFQRKYKQAASATKERDRAMNECVESIEHGLNLIGLTGVEDQLQEDVQMILEKLRHAGIKIWMLTGDKRETATCISLSSKLIARDQKPYQMECRTAEEAEHQLNEFSMMQNTPLIVDGQTLQYLLDHYKDLFYESAKSAPSVVCCRVSPKQKAKVVKMVKLKSGKQVAAIGDGGNDVSMILNAHVGIGIVGKEGRQASLAADYSINQFSHIGSLLLWHGRNSYLNSANLSQFVIFRGIIFSVCQAIYSSIFYVSPTVLWTGNLVVGYSLWNTMLPVFALCINQSIDQETAFLFPELYQQLRQGRCLNAKTFLLWILLSLFQSTIIMFPALLIGPSNYMDFTSMTFTALIFILLVDLSLLITRWSTLLVTSVISTFAIYPISTILLYGYYSIGFVSSYSFWLQSFILTLVATIPLIVLKIVVEKLQPPAHHLLQE